MLKNLSIESAKPRKSQFKFGVNSKNKHNSGAKLDDKDKVGNNKVDGNEVGDNKIAKEKNNQKTFKSKKMVRSLDFFTFGARLAFIILRQVFVKASIFYHFDSKGYI